MAKPRKMLGRWDSPYIQSLMALIETQSKETIVHWCLDYTEEFVLPIYEAAYPDDPRPRQALNGARQWMAGEIKLPAAKQMILASHAAAREAEDSPAAQAAARACGQAAASIHMPSHSLGMAFYGAAAIAYTQVGTQASPQTYEDFAAQICGQMEHALRVIAVEEEPNPAKINWRC